MFTQTRSPHIAHVPMRATVARIETLSPTFRRFTLTGPEISTVADNRLDQRFKILFPVPGVGLDSMPPGDDWYLAWRQLDNSVRPVMRTYTVREVRPEAAEFDVDIALHGRIGPASAWALDARPGDELIVCVPHTGFEGDFHGGVDWRPPAEARRILIAADETALPAVSGIFERLGPEVRGAAIVEVPHPEDAAAISAPPEGVQLIVVARGTDPVGARLVPAVREAADTLLSAAPRGGAQEIEDVDIDQVMLWEVPHDLAGNPLGHAPFFAWLAGEASPIKELRRFLVSEKGVDRHSVAFMGYWRSGRPEMT